MENETKILLYLYKHATVFKEGRRYHAVLLVKTGKRISEVAKLFYVTEDAVRTWIRMWDKEKKVKDKKRSGRPPKLTQEEEEELCRLMDENNPQEHGYNVATWDCVELRRYIQDKFNKELSVETIRLILKRNEFKYKKVNFLFTKRDEGIRNQFVKELFSLFETKEKNTNIMFCDEITTKLHPNPGYVWVRNGKAYVKTNCSHKKVKTIAAINPLSGEKVGETYDKNNAESFVNFLQKLEQKIDNKIVLVLDNYPVHHSKKVRAYIEKSDKFKFKFLPKYSPDLNPIEWLWGYMRKKYLNSRLAKTVEELKEIIIRALNDISPNKVQRICTLKILEKHLII